MKKTNTSAKKNASSKSLKQYSFETILNLLAKIMQEMDDIDEEEDEEKKNKKLNFDKKAIKEIEKQIKK